jgi:NADH dehydrogenase
MNRLLKGALAVGGGAAAAEVLRRALRNGPRYEPWERVPYSDFPNRVLVVGGGFAGYKAAETLCKLTRSRDDVGIMVVSRENYFTFWPMLAGVISSDVQTQNVAQPLRRALIRLGASFRRAGLDGVDPERRIVTAEGREFPYEHLVLALGAEPAYFGIPGVEEHCISIKGIEAGEQICNRVIERYEETTLEGEVPESRLTFVVIGGGATGVEVASEIHTLVHENLAPDYPNIDPHRVRIILLEALPNILPELDPALRKAARARMVNQRIEVRTNAMAQEITENCVKLKGGNNISTENVIWTAGNRPNLGIEADGLPVDERTGIKVDEYLRVEGHENVWAIGDCAAVQDVRAGQEGKIVPPTAQAAVQEGHVVARNIMAVLDGREDDLKRFEYRPIGQLVELGSDFAVNEVMGVRFTGLIAAIFWRMAYLVRLNSPQSKVHIAADWIVGLFLRPAVTQIRGTSER